MGATHQRTLGSGRLAAILEQRVGVFSIFCLGGLKLSVQLLDLDLDPKEGGAALVCA